MANRQTVATYWREYTANRRDEARAKGLCLICFDALGDPDHPSMCRDCRNKKNRKRQQERAAARA